MLRKVLLLSSILTVASSAFASEPMSTVADPQDEILQEMDNTLMLRGHNMIELEFDEPVAVEAVSVVFERTFLCYNVGINGIEILGEAGEWLETDIVRLDGRALFTTPSDFSRIRLSLVAPRRSRCNLKLMGRLEPVPEILNILGEVTESCTEDGDTTACEFSAIRLDSEGREILRLSGEEVLNHGLLAGSIYKFNGFMKLDETGLEFFHIQSSELVMSH